MKKLLSFVSVSMLAATAFSASAAELKMGIVNVDQVLLKSPLAISYNEKLSKDFKPRQDAVNTAQRKLQDELDQLNYGSYKMTLEERNKLQQTINSDRRDFDALNAGLQKDLLAAQSQYTQALTAKLADVLNKIAKDGNYDVIESRANLLYVNNALDVTPQVIQQLK